MGRKEKGEYTSKNYIDAISRVENFHVEIPPDVPPEAAIDVMNTSALRKIYAHAVNAYGRFLNSDCGVPDEGVEKVLFGSPEDEECKGLPEPEKVEKNFAQQFVIQACQIFPHHGKMKPICEVIQSEDATNFRPN